MADAEPNHTQNKTKSGFWWSAIASQGNRLATCIEPHTIFGLYMDSQAPYKDSDAVPETTKSLASSLRRKTSSFSSLENSTDMEA